MVENSVPGPERAVEIEAPVGHGPHAGGVPGPVASEPRPGAVQRRGSWSPLIWYSLVAAATQMLWLTFAAITTDTAHHYRVSVAAVGWLSEIFPLLYVVLAIPAGALLDRHFRPALGAAAGLMAAGAFIRLGGGAFFWAITGQVAIAVAQPVILSAIGRLAGEYLAEGERGNGIAVGSAGNFVGMLVALGLGPAVGAHGHLARLLAVEAMLALIPVAGLVFVLRRPGHVTQQRSVIAGGVTKALWRIPELRTLCGLVLLGFGIFVALATWLQTLLHPDGVSDTTAGVVLVGMVVAGVVGCAALAPLVSRRRCERSYMFATVAVTTVGCLVCAADSSLAERAVVLVTIGLLLLSALPIVLTRSEQIAGPHSGTAGAIVWMAGNLGGLIVALLVQVLVHHPFDAFVAMAAVAALGFPLASRLPLARDRELDPALPVPES